MKTYSAYICFALMIISSCGDKKAEESTCTDSVIEAEVEEINPNLMDSENYASTIENKFISTIENPLSTFSIDVDNASYSNTRRYIQNGQLPPTDAVRVEEFINYFSYDYPQPKIEDPFAINSSVATCPWNKEHVLVQIGLQGKNGNNEILPKLNIVFLIDISGSMNDENKLPLLKKSMKMMVENMKNEDRISLVVYAGAAGLVLSSTSCRNRDQIFEAIDNLHAGGSTAGGEGIELAYRIAEENYIKDGNNRIILATDGDFNLGVSSNEDLKKLVEGKRKSGIYITILGFGSGNLKDDKMELMANNGNGNYYYIDNEKEAKKVLVTQARSTLFTIAKDVKIQVEFNANLVKNYRLIGYENRILNNSEFENDNKDAGEIGVGHTVTALYELELATQNDEKIKSNTQNNSTTKLTTSELLKINIRYKKPNTETSLLIYKTVLNSPTTFENASPNLQFAAAVASFGMILKKSNFKGDTDFKKVEKWANASKGEDINGYRNEFIELVKQASELE